MAFWLFMLAMDLLIPISMVAIGWRFLKKAPAEINQLYGYRTAMSMKNKETWEFAHRYCGKLWIVLGLALLPLSLISLLFVLNREISMIAAVGTVVCFIQIIPMLCSVLPTEIALRKRFDKSGNKRTTAIH